MNFERKRAVARSFSINSRRLTVSLMMQPVVMHRLLEVGGGASRGLGFLARFLISYPVSTMGTRLYRDSFDAEAMKPFELRLRELLSMPLPTEGQNMALVPPVLSLSERARRRWIELHDDVEKEVGKTGEFARVADFAAKTAENAARIAAVTHVFQHGPTGEISDEKMEAAASIASWHLLEALRVIGSTAENAGIADAELLLDWLLKQTDIVSRRDIQNRGPSKLRDDRPRLDKAIMLLAETRNVSEVTIGKATVLVVNPVLRGAA